MTRFIRSEWLKLRHNLVLGVMLLVLILISFTLAGASFHMLPENLTAETPRFFTGVEMMRGEFVFRKVMSDSSFSSWLSIVFAALFIGLDFSNRSINQAIFAGISRFHIYIVKILEFYIVACLVSNIYPLISCLRYSLPWFASLSSVEILYVMRCIGLKMLLDMAIMSISVIATFALRDFIRPMAFTLIFSIVLAQLLGMRHSLDSASALYQMMNLYPAFQYAQVMIPAATNEQILIALFSSLAFIMLTSVISYFLFKKAELN